MPAHDHQTYTPELTSSVRISPLDFDEGTTALFLDGRALLPFPSTTPPHAVTTVGDCLLHLGLTLQDLVSCPLSVEAEFRAVKRAFLERALREHPDRFDGCAGEHDCGADKADGASFRRTRACFEALRALVVEGRVRLSFAAHWHDPAPECDALWEELVRDGPAALIPSYSYYFEAAAAAAAPNSVPVWTVQAALSGRGHCVRCKSRQLPLGTTDSSPVAGPGIESPPTASSGGGGDAAAEEGAAVEEGPAAPDRPPPRPRKRRKAHPSLQPHAIPYGTLRVGRWEADRAGSYGGWVHLGCWQVSHAVWSGLSDVRCARRVDRDLRAADGVVWTGFSALTEPQRLQVAEHAQNPAHWDYPPPPTALEVWSGEVPGGGTASHSMSKPTPQANPTRGNFSEVSSKASYL